MKEWMTFLYEIVKSFPVQLNRELPAQYGIDRLYAILEHAS